MSIVIGGFWTSPERGRRSLRHDCRGLGISVVLCTFFVNWGHSLVMKSSQCFHWGCLRKAPPLPEWDQSPEHRARCPAPSQGGGTPTGCSQPSTDGLLLRVKLTRLALLPLPTTALGWKGLEYPIPLLRQQRPGVQAGAGGQNLDGTGGLSISRGTWTAELDPPEVLPEARAV